MLTILLMLAFAIGLFLSARSKVEALLVVGLVLFCATLCIEAFTNGPLYQTISLRLGLTMLWHAALIFGALQVGYLFGIAMISRFPHRM